MDHYHCPVCDHCLIYHRVIAGEDAPVIKCIGCPETTCPGNEVSRPIVLAAVFYQQSAIFHERTGL